MAQVYTPVALAAPQGGKALGHKPETEPVEMGGGQGLLGHAFKKTSSPSSYDTLHFSGKARRARGISPRPLCLARAAFFAAPHRITLLYDIYKKYHVTKKKSFIVRTFFLFMGTFYDILNTEKGTTSKTVVPPVYTIM